MVRGVSSRPSARCASVAAFVLAGCLGTTSPAAAEPATGWSAAFPRIRSAVGDGAPFVVHVTVPLCDNALIDCGSAIAGDPSALATNLYWGAVFGARRFFDRKGSGWERVGVADATFSDPGSKVPAGARLERVVYRRRVARSSWGLSGDGAVEQLVVLDAFHGKRIDDAVRAFFAMAKTGATVAFSQGGERRTVRVQVAGYAGHNRLMDVDLAPAADERAPAVASSVPSFVMACRSEPYFTPTLGALGSTPLVMTTALMAPEGYVVDALAKALGDDRPRAEVRDATVRAYARWQRLSPGVASHMFAR